MQRGVNPYWFIVFLVCLMLAVQGCVMPVEITPPAERQVFVKCILEKGNPIQRATLLYSGGIGEKYFEPVEDAVVTVGGVTAKGRVYEFQYIGDGVYEVGMAPKDGETYVLKAVIPGRDTLVASTTMPPAFSLSSAITPPEEWLRDEAESFKDGGSWYIYIDPWVNPWAEDYDAISGIVDELSSEMPGMVFQTDSPAHHHLYVLGRMEDSTGVVGPIRELATNHLLVDNVNANGRTYLVEDEPADPDTSRRPKYERIIKRYYEGLSLHSDYLRIDYPQNYDNGLDKENNRYFSIVGDFEYNIWGAYDHKETHPVLYFCSVSEEYDRYLRTVQASLADAEGDLLSTLYGEAGGYSNVRGGYGVFGAVSTLRHDCDLQITYEFFKHQMAARPYPASPAALPEL
jgi:hypothetical protein